MTNIRMRVLRGPIALIIGLAAAACVQAAEPDRGVALTEGWLVGSWVPEGEHCASDAGIVFERDRTWMAEGTIGTWHIERERIVTVARERDDGGPPEPITPPERSVLQVQTMAQDAFVSRLEDGTVIRWIRCPSVQD